MICSPELGELAKAFSKAQSEIKHAARDAENPFFKSHYATLASVWNACREALTKNGLSVVQTIDHTANHIVVNTILLHTSGQWIESALPLPRLKADIQALGSEITYARRYALAAIVGVATEDDDGNQASQPQVKSETARPAARGYAVGTVITTNPPHLVMPTMPQAGGGLDGPGEFLITFGKNTGKKICEIPDLVGWANWMRGQTIKGKAKEALDMADAYLSGGSKVDILEPEFNELNPPPFEESDILPF